MKELVGVGRKWEGVAEGGKMGGGDAERVGLVEVVVDEWQMVWRGWNIMEGFI